MEKAPGAGAEPPEEKPKVPAEPKLTEKDQSSFDYHDQVQSYFERTGEKELAEDIAAAKQEMAGPARARGAEAELADERRALQELEKDAQENRLTERYKEAGYDRAKAHALADEEAERRTARIRELENIKAAEEKPNGIEPTEDMVVKPRDKYDKTLEDDSRVDVDALNQRYEKTLDDNPDTGVETKSPEKQVEKSKTKMREREDPLEAARPNVREQLMKIGIRAGATFIERGTLAASGKLVGVLERIAGYPTLKRERAAEEMKAREQELFANREEQKKYAGDPKALAKLQSEEEGYKERFIEAKLALSKRQRKEDRFKVSARVIENSMRTAATEVLENIDSRLRPYERQRDKANEILTNTDKRLGRLNKRFDAYQERLAEQRAVLRGKGGIADKALQEDIDRLQKRLNMSKPLVARIIKRHKQAESVLRQNESRARPLRNQRQRFARAAGLEINDDIIAKGSPPEDLPVMPKGGLRSIEGGKKEPKEGGSVNVERFIKKWNREALLDGRPGWRIKDREHFKYLVGTNDTMTPMRAEHLARKYFEDQAAKKGRVLTERQYRQAGKRGRQFAKKIARQDAAKNTLLKLVGRKKSS